ncbi:hypothetical protein WN944_013815 [Citrus x changshan-huyou]|uniref:Uncharacterized protein n=1 Tax=Citrus x changshan-huyou TaxID=2935761 RepID=A0AAP0M5Q4_9ROSI
MAYNSQKELVNNVLLHSWRCFIVAVFLLSGESTKLTEFTLLKRVFYYGFLALSCIPLLKTYILLSSFFQALHSNVIKETWVNSFDFGHPPWNLCLLDIAIHILSPDEAYRRYDTLCSFLDENILNINLEGSCFNLFLIF